MKHLIIFSIIILGIILLTLSYQTFDNFVNNDYSLYESLYLGTSKFGGKYGRGVFANKKFNIGDLIEKAPYIEDDINKFNGISRDYVFNTKDAKVALGFGYVSLYNHNDKPNALWYIDDKNIIIKAIKPINKEDEILISYGNEYWTSRYNLNKISFNDANIQ